MGVWEVMRETAIESTSMHTGMHTRAHIHIHICVFSYTCTRLHK